MKAFILSAALIAVLSNTAQAQAQAPKELVRELFTIMHQDSVLQKTMEATSASMARQMTASLSMLDSATSKGIKDAMSKSMTTSREAMVKMMKEEMVDIYAKHFTTDEINQFITFYKTAPGQKMIQMTPTITKEIMDIMSVKYTPVMQQALLKDMQKVLGEMKLQKPM